MRRTWDLIGPARRKRFLLVGLLATAVSGLEAVAALLIAILLSLVLEAGAIPDFPVIGDPSRYFPGASYEEFVLWTCGVFALFFVVRGLVFLFQQYAQAKVVENTGMLLSDRLVDGYLSMPYEWHLQRNSAELIRNAYDNVQQVTGGILLPMATLVAEFALATALLLVLLVSSPLITLVAIIGMTFVIATTLLVVQPRLKLLGQQRNRAAKSVMQDLQQGFGGIRDVKVLGTEATFARAFRRGREDMAEAQYMRAALAYVPRTTVELTFLVMILGALALATSRGQSEEVLSVLGLFAYAGLRLQPSLQKISTSFNSLKFAEAAVADLTDGMDLLDASLSARRLADRDLEPLPFRRSLQFASVEYAYPGTELPALVDVDLTVHRGESIGIAGSTGGGKTTLLDLVCGLLDPTSGQITVDGVPLAGRTRAWQRGLGVVHQASFLTDDTIRSNVALGLPNNDIDDEHVRECLDMAQLTAVVEDLPDGVDTVVGERGVRLSGGQRQRIAIARALYRRPNVLVLDEGTASLDNDTERRLIQKIRALDVTLIMVAHRLSTIEQCDRIVLVAEGRLRGVGTYAELVASSETFRALAATS